MTRTAVAVLCAVRGPDETAAVTALDAAGAAVVRRCAELSELLAAAEAGAGSVAVVSADLPGLGREAVARLRSAGARVVVLTDGRVPAPQLAALGPDTVVPGAPLDPETLLAAVSAGPGAATPEEPVVEDVGRPGTVVAVWGASGSPGRTTAAIELAAALAGHPGRGTGRRAVRRRRRVPPPPRDSVLLVDADTYAPSVAARLGLLDDAPGLAAAARAAGQGVLDLPTLARYSPAALPGVRVLTGLTRAARWPELPASSLEVVWARARELATWTVVDCGPLLEADELLMYDTRAPQRNAATLAALAAADVVVVVGAADPVGLQRLVRGLEELAEAPVPVAGARVVVANRVRPGTAGARPEAAVRDALARYAGVVDVHVVPDDPTAADAALFAGRAICEQAPGSPAAAAFAALAGRVRALVPAA